MLNEWKTVDNVNVSSGCLKKKSGNLI